MGRRPAVQTRVRPALGWECPTGCGWCCVNPEIPECRPLAEGSWCKHHTDDGCGLPRGKRPRDCLDYLCPEVAAHTPDYPYR